MHKILYTTSFSELVGGGQVSLLLLFERLDRGRFSPLLVVPAEGEVARRARTLGAEVRVFEFPPLRRLFGILPALWRFRSLLKDESIALIHAEQPRAAIYASLARLGLDIRLVWHVRTMIHDPLDAILERSVDRLILVAKALKERFSQSAQAKTVVVYNGLDVDAAPGAPGPGLPKAGSPLIVCPARLEKDKGQHVLLEAAARLKGEFPGLGIWLVGRGDSDYEEGLRRQAAPLGPGVAFLGQRDDVPALLALADVVVLCSTHEAFPRVPLEAMAAGKPVAATDVGGVSEAVVDGETGLLVPPGDPDRLAEALRRLLSDGALRKKMGNAGRERVRRFSSEATSAAVQQLYASLLAPREKTPCAA